MIWGVTPACFLDRNADQWPRGQIATNSKNSSNPTRQKYSTYTSYNILNSLKKFYAKKITAIYDTIAYHA